MKIIRIFLLVFLGSFLILSVSADNLNPLIYQYTNPEITVEFSVPLEISEERQKEIADELAGVPHNVLYYPGVSHPDNIICTLFGHDLAPQASVTVTHHKVRQYNPRCLIELYHVTYCKRCEYTVSELHNSSYILCCPED